MVYPTAKDSSFKSRVAAGNLLIGTFLKFPSIPTVELLAEVGFDYMVIDQEHAPIDRTAADTMIFAAKALGLGALVRLPRVSDEYILSSLDSGADGLLAPHIFRGDIAESVVAAGRYAGRRGYSGSPRSSGYGAGKMATIVAEADRNVLTVAQIEDFEAMDQLDAIAGCDGIDALFVGRGDLTVSLGLGRATDAVVWELAAKIADAAKAAGKAVGGFADNASAALRLHELGATLIILGSDQAFLRRGAQQALAEFR